MEQEELKLKLKEIDNMVKDLSEPLKTIATTRLTKELWAPSKEESQGTQEKREKQVNPKNSEDSDFQDIVASIKKTDYPEIYQLQSVYNQSLFVLKLAKEKGKNGLTPAQIHHILFDVFSIKASKPNINMSLYRDKNFVDKKGNRGKRIVKTYFIVKKGEDYVDGIVKETKDRNPAKTLNTTGENEK